MSAVLRAVAVAARAPRHSVFSLREPDALQRWGDRKLAARPRSAAGLVVEVRDPRRLSDAEHAAILARLRTANMAVYASRATDDDPAIVRGLAERLGLRTPHRGPLDGDDGIARIAADAPGSRQPFIACTSRRMLWHTDGYANPALEPVRARLLHCVQDAAGGGETALLDPELAWLALARQGFEWVRALMAPDALTIPARVGAAGIERAAAAGPVFSLDPRSGDLQTRFTARRRHVQWRRDALSAEAAARLLAIMDRDAGCVLRLRLAPGMGIVCNNVLHARGYFEDSPQHTRTMLRARFLERIPGTEGAWDALAR